MRAWPAWVVESVAWWAACWGVWLVSLSAVSGQELVVSAAVSIPCGLLAVVGRRAARNGWRFRLSWFSPLVRLPVAIVGDSIQVLARAASTKRPAGEMRRFEVGSASGESTLACGRRSLFTLLVCITPASVVTDFEEEPGEALVHVIGTHGPSMPESVAD